MAISGYADVLSVLPGGALNLYVSTDAPQFRVEFYRQGATLAGPLAGMPVPDLRAGVKRPPGKSTAAWGWQSYPFTIPGGWQSGAYIAMFVEVGANGVDLPNQPLDRSSPDGPDRKALFVVRQPPAAARPVLVKIPTATYAAYNFTGGGSTYTKIPRVTLHRPGCGTGGETSFALRGGASYQQDVYDQDSDRHNFVHLEAPFIRWLERNQYVLDYCTDFDLHFTSGLLDPYQLLLSIGHDEYWTKNMRDAVAAMIQRGGNVAFFSGNTCYKYSEFPSATTFHNKGTWQEHGLPVEDSLTGVSYTHGGGRWTGKRQILGYTLQHGDHWALRDVALTPALGAVYPDNGEQAALIGYECDGAPFAMQDGMFVRKGAPTPADFLILGNAKLDRTWQDLPEPDPRNRQATHQATIGLYTSSGVALTTGTTDWGRVLDSRREPRVERLTRNVIDALSIRQPTGWSSRGAQLTSTPAVASNADGRLEVYARDYEGAARHVWQTAPGKGWAAAWASKRGTLAGSGAVETRLAMARNRDGRLQVFARFQDNSIRYLIQKAANGAWAAWASLGGNVAGDPAAGMNADGRLEVFVRGSDGKLYAARQTSPGGAWSGWATRNGSLAGQVAVDRNADGRLEVFARGSDNALWHLAQTAANGGWGAWASLGGSFAGDPMVGTNADGRLEVFARGVEGTLHHAWQASPGGAWSGWASLNGCALASGLAVARNRDGRLEVFARGADHALWHIAQTAANNGWGAWQSFGGSFAGDPAVGTHADGRLEVFIRGRQATLWHRGQASPGVW